MQSEPVIQIQELISKYEDDVILENISFKVYKGEVFVIIGGSGCGKSTLLRHMIGLRRPFSGIVVINGVDIYSDPADKIENALKTTGVLFQSSALIGSMTIAENIALPISEYSTLSKSSIDNLVRMKLCRVGLGEYADHLPSEISGGMKKRAGLARAMALNPEILFLDEPSAGLDPVTSAGIDELILHINQSLGTTIIIVTHELQSILNIAGRVIMLDKTAKGIIAEGDPLSLKENSDDPAVRQFFNRRANPS